VVACQEVMTFTLNRHILNKKALKGLEIKVWGGKI